MQTDSVLNPTDLGRAFLDYERQVRIRNYQVGCLLAFFFVPLGALLDYFVYRDRVGEFFLLRCGCSVLLGLIWFVLQSKIGMRFYSALGLLVALLPLFFISWMIYEEDGWISPYYAGLNLVMLGAAILMRWTLRDSILVFVLALVSYLAACLFNVPDTQSKNPGARARLNDSPQQTPGDQPQPGKKPTHQAKLSEGIFFNNVYFLVVTGVFIITGSWYYNRIRFREFQLRYELDHSRELLEQSNQKLLELDQVKGRFFANISHELRTPLTLLLAPLEALLHRSTSAFDEETRELLGTMHSNSMRLLKLINDLLDLVRLESGKMEIKLEPVEIAEFVKGLASSARQMANDKRLRLETSVDPDLGEVLGDRDKLDKILRNLLFNALKFTPAGGKVEMRAEKQGSELILIVEDTGMGISEKNLPHVFDRFWQADDSSKRKYQGVGIGLALVKELVEIQGGKVSVESKEGQGSVFTIRLPYQKSEAGLQTEKSEKDLSVDQPISFGTVSSEEWLANLYRRAELFPAMTPLQETLRPVDTFRNGGQPTILIADDEPDMLRFLKSQLNRQYHVLEAVDGQQAVDKASQFLPDVILLDMMMPEKDGLQACRELRGRTSTQSIPIILLTARADEETKLAALSAGASDFLSKPFSTTELHVRIKNLVESHLYQRKLGKQNQTLEVTIEQLKETETQLVQTEKLASLGRMAAGIIHEINNPLNFATTGLFTLRNKGQFLAVEQQAEYAEVLKDVEEGITRVKTIVLDLRSFAYQNNEQLDEVDVKEVVTSSLRFLSHEWKGRVQIIQNFAEGQTIEGNKNKLIQVVVNLLQNSMDALRPTAGKTEPPTVWINGCVEQGKSRLSIRDNGEGITAENLSKVFDPFFTTKDVGEGMGLGLSICYRIVDEYKGQITVKSEPGKFCEFTLEFPIQVQPENNLQ